MTRSRQHRSIRLLSIAFVSCAVALAAVACGGGDLDLPPTATDTRIAVQVATQAPTARSASTAEVVGTPLAPTQTPSLSTIEPTTAPVAPTATEEPPAPSQTPLPASDIVFDPPELIQGGSSVVYFNEPASAATLSFGGRQYPMLPAGDGSLWAMIGVGAFSEAGLAPVTITYNPASGGDQATMTQSIPIVAREFPIEQITLDPQTSSLLQPEIIQNELNIRASIFSGYTVQRYWSGAFVQPAGGVVTAIYGEGRSYNGAPVTDYHHGTDFQGSTGDPAHAAAAGVVVFADDLQVRGNAIIIDHGAGVFTSYNHLSAFNVQAGESVVPGQQIGQIGSTGLVTGPHLHWEVIVRGIEVDGLLWLEGTEIGP